MGMSPSKLQESKREKMFSKLKEMSTPEEFNFLDELSRVRKSYIIDVGLDKNTDEIIQTWKENILKDARNDANFKLKSENKGIDYIFFKAFTTSLQDDMGPTRKIKHHQYYLQVILRQAPEFIQMLIENDIDLANIQDGNKNNLLHYLIMYDMASHIKLLKKFPIYIPLSMHWNVDNLRPHFYTLSHGKSL